MQNFSGHIQDDQACKTVTVAEACWKFLEIWKVKSLLKTKLLPWKVKYFQSPSLS